MLSTGPVGTFCRASNKRFHLLCLAKAQLSGFPLPSLSVSLHLDAIQNTFNAEYISNVTWVSEGLEVFRCQIADLQRLNQLIEEESSKEEQRVREENQYTVDGNEYRDYGGVIRNTLHLSLASGLDRLSTLKNLQVFEFEIADLLELECIAEHRPMLRAKPGIQKDRFG
ncbi:hypothetical protein EC957_003648 [Mortierella hygrophila]|uniref:Uncharacterized protein n=1 Tax=Mortierella hygrophila TaxID=979708 RepID=A0A9P6K0Q8_9FUNG|nr:hypothetical protein EC957_003648 [Mortierella hygrophila]